MTNSSDFLPPFSPSKTNPSLFMIVLSVIALHLLLLGLGTFWHPSQPSHKPRSKLIVQTVRLSSFQSEIAQQSAPIPSAAPIAMSAPLPPLPIEQPKLITPPPSIKEEIPPKEESAAPLASTTQKEEVEKSAPSPVVAIPAPNPSSVKAENKAKPTPPKPKPQEAPKKNNQPAPIKKTVEPAKKNEPVKSKKTEEAEKKKQQEQALKKQQEELAEKKRQQEKAEAEKKQQQEIAAAKEAAKKKELILLAKAKENLAKMNETRDKISSSSSVNLDSAAIPKELASLHVDALPLGGAGGSSEWGAKEASYSDEVAYRLKMALKLPDYGAVKIKLTIDRTGKVIKVDTVRSESHKNKIYVESKILTLIFPSFGQKFQGAAQNTFEITLQNDS